MIPFASGVALVLAFRRIRLVDAWQHVDERALAWAALSRALERMDFFRGDERPEGAIHVFQDSVALARSISVL